MSRDTPRKLRFVSYLAPAIPRLYFQAIVDHLATVLGRRASLRLESKFSGPTPGNGDPFADGEVDAGWICSPSYLWLRDNDRSTVKLLPAAPLFRDARIDGKAVLFSDVIVRAEDSARTFQDLKSRDWVYNDPCSMSGYFSALRRLDEIGADADFFRNMKPSGGHMDSIELVIAGHADGAAIDSNVLAFALEARRGLHESIRVLESWGPFAIQPLVVRSDLPESVIDAMTDALLRMHEDEATRSLLDRFHVRRFIRVAEEDYEHERRALQRCESLSAAKNFEKPSSNS